MIDKSAAATSRDEVTETLQAIASGGVDAVVVQGPHGPQVFHLEGPDQPFRTFVERMQEGVLTLAGDGTVLYANGFFASLIGQPVEELIGEKLSRFAPPSYHSTLTEWARVGLSSTVKGQCRLEANGATIPVQLTLSPLVGGSRPSCCVVVFDLRQREQLEQAHAARNAAEQASKAKDQFLAVLSHELRSPLNSILGWSQILASDPTLSDTARRAVETIERNARTQAALIADLLDISRIIAGKLHLEQSHTDLAAIVEACLMAAKPLLEQKGLRLTTRIEPTADVYGDPTRLQQILTNLLNNAVKFTPTGGTIDVSLETEEDILVLRVADTGIGMGADLLDHVFDVFAQGKTGQQRSGLGLGLAIARQLVEAHGGALVAESNGPERGSTFTMRIPRAARSLRSPAPNLRPSRELSGVAVLVVDDDKDTLELTRFLLESADCKVTTAATAEAALAALANGEFALFISDIGLPDQNGLELMREVRARGFSADRMPAIALTGYAGTHDARLVRAAGYQKHIAKPIEAAALIREAADILSR